MPRPRTSIFIGVLLVAAFVRLWHLGYADVINDESLIAFRSVGLIDFLFSPYQTTPWEWLSPIPWWAYVSFHDHPPVVFFVQHFFFSAFGVHAWVLRLPFALAGIATVALTYYIGKQIASVRAGLIASAMLAVSSYHVWISRIGLQESIVILLWLAALYLFLKNQDNTKSWRWGVVFGLALLTKYTALFLLPVFFIIQFLYSPKRLASWHFWLGWVIAGLVWSPVWFYNIFLYQATGHFDLQFSYLFGQDVAAWEYLPGKLEIGTFADRAWGIVPALYRGLLLPQTLLGIAAFLWIGWDFFAKLKSHNLANDISRGLLTIVLAFVFLLTLLLIIGPSLRFTAMIAPLIAIMIGVMIASWPRRIIPVVAILLIAELFLTINTLFVDKPWGKISLTYSRAHNDAQRFGYADLTIYLEKVLAGHYPAVTFSTRYDFLESIKNESVALAAQEGDNPRSLMLVYDDELYGTGALWALHRQMIYQGWPIITRGEFVRQGEPYWRAAGITEVYYIHALEDLLLFEEAQRPSDELVITLNASTQSEKIILPDGRAVFEIYHW